MVGIILFLLRRRQSAFDRVLASIPFKGLVLNETSLWWFDKTRHIAQNAVVSTPDKNVTIAKKCSVFPVEFVVKRFCDWKYLTQADIGLSIFMRSAFRVVLNLKMLIRSS